MVSACDNTSNPEVTQERKDVHYATHHEIRLLCEPASSGIEVLSDSIARDRR
jgi:hypothetical protein